LYKSIKKRKMKKTIFAIVSSLVLMSCGGAETTEATQSDSAQVVDSSVTAQDTTTAEITEDGGGIQDGTEIK
jgi:ABC-type glycerol-3-phosphate transport system substrate-binding protein